MSFKWPLLLLVLAFGLASCGVKGPPVAPKGSAIPSYSDKFLYPDGVTPEKESEERKEQQEQTQ